MQDRLSILMITCQYPTTERPTGVPFIARQVDSLRAAGVDIDLFHFQGRKNLFNYVKAWLELRRFSRGKNYDLMHAQWGHSAAIALPKRLPWVITFRGNDLEGIIGKNGKPTFLGQVQQLVSKLMASKADRVVVVSESLARHLKRKDQLVLPSGLDLEVFKPRPRAKAREMLDLATEKKLILFAASSVDNPRKRFALAQSAVELIKDSFDVELLVATNVPHHRVALYMNACDALLLTSVHEGSPNVVKEALACNLPVVSVDVGDVAQRIGSVEGCFVSEDDSPQSIADALTKVLSEGKRIEGRETVASLDESLLSQKVIDVYKSVLYASERRSAELLPTDDLNTVSACKREVGRLR